MWLALRWLEFLEPDSLFNEQGAQLPAEGKASPGMETVMPFPGVEKKRRGCMDRASGRVGLHRITGEAMAFDEHLIDFVNRLPAIAGRMARPERRLELRSFSRSPASPASGRDAWPGAADHRARA